MAIERERKFMVHFDRLPPEAFLSFFETEAGYFTNDLIAIRVTSRKGGKQKVCFKGPGTEEREEFEYVIPKEDAERLLALAPTNIKKTRYEYQGWEIDSLNIPGGLWVAEWEEAEGKPSIPSPLPVWIGEEITGKAALTNMALAWTYGRR